MRCNQSRWRLNQGQKALNGGPETVQTNRAASNFVLTVAIGIMAISECLTAATVLYHPEPELLLALCRALESANIHLYAVRNSAIPSSLINALEGSESITLIGDGANVGLGAALNAAMEAAAARGFTHVLLLDQDSTPETNLPAALLERIKAIGIPVGAIAPRLIPPPAEGYKPIWYSFRAGGAPGALAVDFLPTSGSLVALNAWRVIGPFRADFFIDGIDVEWSFRAWAAGYSIILADDLSMRHCWGLPSENARRFQVLRQSQLRNAYYLRNSTYALRLPHLPWQWKLRSGARLAAQMLLLAARGQGDAALRAVLAGWRGELGPISLAA